MNPINVANTSYHLLKLLSNPDGNIKSLIFLGDKITAAPTSSKSAEILFENEQLNSMYFQRLGLKQIKLSHLENMDTHTFGKKVFHFYVDNGLDMYPMQNQASLSPAAYISERTRKLHDFLHVMLGYGTDLIGEAKVNAFVANQIRMPMSFLILSGIIIKYFFTQPTQFNALVAGIADGWAQGSKHKNFLALDWDDMLEWTSEDVQEYCAIQNCIQGMKSD